MLVSQMIIDLTGCLVAGLVYWGLLWTINASLQETQREREKREVQQRKLAHKSVRRRR